MLTDHEKAAALKIVLAAKDPEDFPITNDRLCREFPNIQTDDLIALWREAGERQLRQNPYCRMCKEQGRVATVVDHIEPHKGDPELFWDRETWQGLCATCHSGAKQTRAGLGYLSSTVMERLPNIVGWGGMFSLEPGHWVPGPNFFSYIGELKFPNKTFMGYLPYLTQ